MDTLKTASLSVRAQAAIMQLIRGMDLERGNKLPREEVLAEQLGVSRTTIRQALNNLAAEGVITRHQGKGTFVNAAAIGVRVTFSPCMEIMQAIRNSGYEPSVRLLSSRVVDDEALSVGGGRTVADVREALGLACGERLVEHDKVFFADGAPCAFCRDYFGEEVAGGAAGVEELERFDDSIYRFMYRQSGRRVEWDKVEIDVALTTDLPDAFASVMSSGGAARPLLCIRSLNYDQDSRPVLYATECIDTSIILYNLVRRKAVDYDR